MMFEVEDENYKYLRESRTSFENNVPILIVTEFEVDRKTGRRSAISRFDLKGLPDFPKFTRNLVMYNKSENGFRYVFSFCNSKYFIEVYKIDEHTLDWSKNLWNLEIYERKEPINESDLQMFGCQNCMIPPKYKCGKSYLYTQVDDWMVLDFLEEYKEKEENEWLK